MHGLHYSVENGRWEFGSRTDPKFCIPDNASRVAGIFAFNVTSATTTVPTQGAAVCTLPTCLGIKANQSLIVNPRTNMSIGIAAARAYADDYVILELVNPNAASALIVKGTSLDILAINTE